MQNLVQKLLLVYPSVSSPPLWLPLPFCPCEMLFSQNWGKTCLVRREFKLNLVLYIPVSLNPSIYINLSRPVFAKPL